MTIHKDVEGMSDFDGFDAAKEDELLNDANTHLPEMLVKRRRVKKRPDTESQKRPQIFTAEDGEDDFKWGELMTFGDKNYLAKIRKQETKLWLGFEICGLVVAVAALIYCYFFFDHFHFNICKIYGHLGHVDAQHKVGERLLYGKGVEKDEVMFPLGSQLAKGNFFWHNCPRIL